MAELDLLTDLIAAARRAGADAADALHVESAALSVAQAEWEYVRPFLDLKARVDGLRWELATPMRAT